MSMYCENCGKYFADAEGKKEIEKDSWIIKAGGHQAGDVTVLLRIKDTTGNAEIDFLSDKTNRITFADGSKEKGDFMLKDDAIVLVNEAGVEMQIAPDGEGYKLSYPAGEDSLEFQLKTDDMAILEKAV